MPNTDLDLAFSQMVETTAEKVAGLGFRRRGAVLRIIKDNCAGVIEFQKSTESSRRKIIFTVNLAVICGVLQEKDDPSIETARSMNAHLRQRIGMLMPGRSDHWWEILDSGERGAIASEVSDVVATLGAPYVVNYIDFKNLIALWKSGESPGLTKVQCLRYLDRL